MLYGKYNIYSLSYANTHEGKVDAINKKLKSRKLIEQVINLKLCLGVTLFKIQTFRPAISMSLFAILFH